MSNSPFVTTVLADFHLLVIWCIGFVLAVRYRHQQGRTSWLTGIALLLLLGSVFTMLPILGLQSKPNVDFLRVIAVWSVIRMIGETAAWILLLSALFGWQNQLQRSPVKRSEHTILCPHCGRRNSVYSETCVGCQANLSKAGKPVAGSISAGQGFGTALHSEQPRLRGAQRAAISSLPIFISGLLATMYGPPLIITAAVAIVGFAGLPSAAAEILTNRDWKQVSPMLKIFLFLFFAFAFTWTMLIEFGLAMRR